MLTEIRVPAVSGAGWSFQKFNRRAQDWAIVGVPPSCRVGQRRRAGDPGDRPGQHGRDAAARSAGTEAALGSGASAADAAARADEGLEPAADLNASADYRRHLARVLTRRALQEAGV